MYNTAGKYLNNHYIINYFYIFNNISLDFFVEYIYIYIYDTYQVLKRGDYL